MAAAVYGAVVAQARQPAFYAVLGVPDSVTGRFEMVVLHAVLVLERLKREGEPGRDLGQRMFDNFCSDMDQSLRELGFSDHAMPKRMKGLGESFYGRAEAYARSATDAAELAAALGRNVFGGVESSRDAAPLAKYAIATQERLAATPWEAFAAGTLSFPDPAAFAEGAS
jgi:cytochrome b pre-mRNA-processing protein 3